jgi:N-acyl-D-aspartate/D-glutamate deacylase
MYDLKIEGGTLVDGLGAAPRRGDLGIRDGRIAAVGEAPEDARETIDAGGLFVAPGVIDVHTHMDAQILWDPEIGISPRHGVTTIVMGNCGFGVAPTRGDHRDLVLKTLENVEGMDLACLREGLGEDWGFEGFPAYLDVVENRPKMSNVATLVGHTPVRYWVMGHEAMERRAKPEEIEQMRRLVSEALDCGAIGFSTSGSTSQIGYEGKPVPSRLADLDEVLTLASTLEERGRGLTMCAIGKQLSLRQLREIAERTGRPVTYAAIVTDLGGPGHHRSLLERTEQIQADGLRVIPQVSCRPVFFEFNLREPYPFTTSAPAMVGINVLDRLFAPIFESHDDANRIRHYRAPEFRRAFSEQTSSEEWRDRLWNTITIIDSPSQRDYEQRSILDVARELGQAPADVVLGLSLDSDLAARFVMAYVNSDEDEVEKLLRHPGTQIGLSDAGAHASQICDECFPTDLLGHWVREKGSIPLEEAIAMLSARPAELFGIEDRGALQEGLAADVFVFDLQTVGAEPPHLVNDLPAGASRLKSEARGVEWVIVNGTPVLHRGERIASKDEDLPGRLLRSGAA